MSCAIVGTMKKKALITGITGQDGSYLAELLIDKGYRVYGLQRRTSTPNTSRIDHLYDNPKLPNFVTIYGDLSDTSNLTAIINKIEPDEIYNLGAQSDVKISFYIPEYTANVNALGALRMLEMLRELGAKTRFYQAGSSEMFGTVSKDSVQNEKTPFNPQSPYAASKVFAYHQARIYRKSHNIFVANGILFNHESPRRGTNFITRKITLGLVRIHFNLQKSLKLGNLYSQRDWGYAEEYVEGIWRILQHKVADDFVLATGETHSVKEFIEVASQCLNFRLDWQETGSNERGIDKKSGKIIIEIDPIFFRPNDVAYLRGDPTKAQKLLKWKPKITFAKLVEMMIRSDYDLVEKEIKTGRKIKPQSF